MHPLKPKPRSGSIKMFQPLNRIHSHRLNSARRLATSGDTSAIRSHMPAQAASSG